MRRVQFRSARDWLDAGLSGVVAGMQSSDADVLIAACGASLPSIGSYWTALIVIDPRRSRGHAWVNAIRGDHALNDETPRVYCGTGEVPGECTARIVSLVDKHGIGGLESVPQRCYDGLPVSLTVCCRADRRKFDVSANGSDPGREPALALARAVWDARAVIELVEVPQPESPT